MKTTTLQAPKTNALLKVIDDSGLESQTANYLKDSFTPFFEAVTEWKEKAESLIVTNATQTREMKMAREARLALRDVRLSADKKRKELKEDSLRYGKAVQGVYNLIEGLISPIEKHLEQQEKFVEIQEQKRKDELKAVREDQLRPYAEYVAFGTELGELNDDQYAKVFNGAKLQYAAKIEEDRKQEQLKAAQEKERIEQDRRRNEVMKLGLKFDGEQFAYKDVNLHWADLIMMTDEEFEEAISGARIRLQQITDEETTEKETLRLENERLQNEQRQKDKELEALKKQQAKKEADEKKKKETVKKRVAVSGTMKDRAYRLADVAADAISAVIKDAATDTTVDVLTEIDSITEMLKTDIEELEIEKSELKEVFEKALHDGALPCDEALKLITDEDEGPVWDYVKEKGYAVIRLDTMEQRDKLRTFVETELFPFHNDHQRFDI